MSIGRGPSLYARIGRSDVGLLFFAPRDGVDLAERIANHRGLCFKHRQPHSRPSGYAAFHHDGIGLELMEYNMGTVSQSPYFQTTHCLCRRESIIHQRQKGRTPADPSASSGQVFTDSRRCFSPQKTQRKTRERDHELHEAASARRQDFLTTGDTGSTGTASRR